MCLYLTRTLSARKLTIISITLFIGLILLQVGLYIQQKQKSELSRHNVEHSYQQIREVENLFTKISQMEAGQLNYWLTGDNRFLDAYFNGITTADEKNLTGRNRPLQHIITDLRAMYEDDPNQQQEFQILENLLQKKTDHMAKTLDQRQHIEIAETVALTHLNDGKRIMDNLRDQTNKLIALEQEQLQQRIEQNFTDSQSLTRLTVTAAIITYGSLFLMMILIVRIFSRSQAIERKLHAREAWFRAAADGSIDGFFLFRAERDQYGNVTDLLLDYLNPVAETMIRKDLAKALNEPINTIFFPESDHFNTLDTYRGIFERQQPMEREYTISHGPMMGRILQKQAIPLMNGIAVTCRDITERRQMEQMKTEFVSTVSHELRTPLTSIRGALGLVTGGVVGNVPEPVRNLLDIAYNNCERLVRLINDILDIEKIESGRMLFACKSVTLMATINQAITDNLAYADKYGVTLVLDEKHGLGLENTLKIAADGDRLIQIVTNLMSNAIKFSEEGQTVTVRCLQSDKHVKIEVVDQGIGIPLSFQDKVFQKFAQADSSDTRQRSGTGLGLAITKALVDQMHGDISFTSQPSKGTTFHVLFPVLEEEAFIHLPADPADISQSRILVCEDDHDIANLLLLILEKAGFTVDIAQTAQEALSKLRIQTYVAMTLDLVLPDQPNSTFRDGLALIQKIRHDLHLTNLPIVVVSAKAEEGHLHFAGDAIGILDWLAKPIPVEKLVNLIKNLPVSSKKPFILHVEDDNDIAHILAMTLAPVADIIRATDLQQARQAVRQHTFDLVILDLGLPDGQGTDLLPLLKNADGTATPVVLFTASDVTQDISALVAATLVKSRTSEQNLLDTIRRMIIHHTDVEP